MGRPRNTKPLIDRIMEHVERRGENDCWPWTGGLSGGNPRMAGVTTMHRRVYEHEHGSLSHKMAVKRLCNNTICFNPAHLIAVPLSSLTGRGKKLVHTEADFWRIVRKEDPERCWDWPHARHEAGYGVCTYKGVKTTAHRLAYELTNGPVPDGMYVLHTCDRPQCCNPAHLFVGTPKDNVADMLAKGRLLGKHIAAELAAEGRRHLKRIRVLKKRLEHWQRNQKIREEYFLEGPTLSELGERYGRTESAVSLIVNCKR